ncbi:MAG TPA: hypothetical protein PK580_09915 [Nitrosomonas halophila]|nr:hypothetical protein [Nitrosomonas halophila]
MKMLAGSLFAQLMLWLAMMLSLLPMPVLAADTGPVQSGSASAAGQVDWPDEDTVLLRYTQILGGARNGQANPSLTLYQDGTMRVFYPDFLKQAGVYAGRLDPERLDQLWSMLTDQVLLAFDARKVRDLMAAHDQASDLLASVVFSISDAPTLHIEFFPDRYHAAGRSLSAAPAAQKTISWHALKRDARQYTGIAEIQQLYAVQQRLEAIMRQSNLTKIDATH